VFVLQADSVTGGRSRRGSRIHLQHFFYYTNSNVQTQEQNN